MAVFWPRGLPVVYVTGELGAAALFLPVLLLMQLANALPSTSVRIFSNRATFFCPL